MEERSEVQVNLRRTLYAVMQTGSLALNSPTAGGEGWGVNFTTFSSRSASRLLFHLHVQRSAPSYVGVEMDIALSTSNVVQEAAAGAAAPATEASDTVPRGM